MSSSSPPDYYSLLELTPTATVTEIRRSYRRLALIHHPDKNPDNQVEAEEKFKLISEAFSVLSDDAKRRDYDYLRANPRSQARPFPGQSPFGAARFSFMDANRLFRQFFEEFQFGNVDNSPFGNSPFHNSPFSNTPFRNSPFGNSPFGNSPFGNSPFERNMASPFGSFGTLGNMNSPFGNLDSFGAMNSPFGNMSQVSSTQTFSRSSSNGGSGTRVVTEVTTDANGNRIERTTTTRSINGMQQTSTTVRNIPSNIPNRSMLGPGNRSISSDQDAQMQDAIMASLQDSRTSRQRS